MVDTCWTQGWYEQDEPHQAHRNKYQYSSQLRNAPEERATKRTTSTYHCASDSYVSQLTRENKFSATLVFQSMTKQMVTPSLTKSQRWTSMGSGSKPGGAPSPGQGHKSPHIKFVTTEVAGTRNGTQSEAYHNKSKNNRRGHKKNTPRRCNRPPPQKKSRPARRVSTSCTPRRLMSKSQLRGAVDKENVQHPSVTDKQIVQADGATWIKSKVLRRAEVSGTTPMDRNFKQIQDTEKHPEP